MIVSDYEFEVCFEDMLNDAEDLADNDFEVGFVESVYEKYQHYGDDMFFSEAQNTVLKRILSKV